MYDLIHNKGYGSRRHLLALQQHGVSRLHRKSFAPCQIE
jgi:ribonuclease HII